MTTKTIDIRTVDDVPVDENDERLIWRLLYPESLGGVEHGAVAGVASYKPSAVSLELGHPHKNPELYYVVDGEGIMATPDGETKLKAGDSFVTPPGVPHSLWSTTDRPLLTFYVAIRR